MEDEIDRLFVQLSQQLDSSPAHFEDATIGCSSRFATPKTDEEVVEARLQAVPKKTRQDTEYCVRVWDAWRTNRNAHGSAVPSLLDVDMERATLACWLTRFVLEMRKTDGTEYPPNTVHHIVCGVMRHLRCTKPDIDFFKDAEFSSFRSSLDAEMKRLQSKGLGSNHKQAEPLTVQEEEQLWEKNILGDHSPESLLNTIIFMNGLYFALRSGDEHRQLRHKPCQIQVVENEGERPYLLYTEDISKNHPGGLKGRKFKPKVVVHYANTENPHRCFVRLFKKYNALCPYNRPEGAFYLAPLKNPKENCWYSASPIGRNKLAKAVSNMCKECGIQGFRTNHSLRATAATRLYASGVDEQLVMERTGHRSIEGIRSYKRTSSEQQQAVSDILTNTKKHCSDVAIPQLTSATTDFAEVGNSTTQLPTTSNTTNICLPSFLASKTGTFHFNSCNNININFNCLPNNK